MADEIGAAEPASPRRRSSARLWVLAIAIALAVIFVVLNSKQVKINFIFGTATTSLVFALLLAMVLGFVIGWLAARWRAHHRAP